MGRVQVETACVHVETARPSRDCMRPCRDCQFETPGRDPNSDALGIVQFRDYYCFATFKVHSLSGLHLLVFKFFTTIRACHVVKILLV